MGASRIPWITWWISHPKYQKVKGQKEIPNPKKWKRWLTGWWQLQIFLEFSPRNLGKMNPFWRAYLSSWGWNHQLAEYFILWIFSPPRMPGCTVNLVLTVMNLGGRFKFIRRCFLSVTCHWKPTHLFSIEQLRIASKPWLVGLYRGIILPTYIGITINLYKDPIIKQITNYLTLTRVDTITAHLWMSSRWILIVSFFQPDCVDMFTTSWVRMSSFWSSAKR